MRGKFSTLGSKVKQAFFTFPRNDPFKPIEPFRKVVNFGKPDELKKWITTSDKSVGGFSECGLVFDDDQKFTSFTGNLSTKTGKGMHRSGYCAIRSRSLPWNAWGGNVYDFSAYSKLVLDVRGDGRTYVFNLKSEGLLQEDLFQQFVYTRGGPEWEQIELPFKDFLLTYRGYLQNEQTFINLSKVQNFGLTVNDGIDGPFKLDIRQISLKK
eukprot:Nk52_evm30s215 gene=Nk52_evmTU30s215